ncbi:MAG: guanylate kinase [Candidatus Aminicenantes bacterium]|nr:guanylate kinase [Candidatus Aminicenantes bacterium]
MLIVISGPSGCGKTTLVKRMIAEVDELAFSVSFTTRKRRDSEVEGKDYYFVTEDEFKGKIQKQDFVEWAQVHDFYYGTSFQEIEEKETPHGLILDVDIQGARQIKKWDPKALSIFILPPEFKELKKRLFLRGDETKESIEKRLNVAKKEIQCYTEFDFVIINDRLEEAVDNLLALISPSRRPSKIPQEKIEALLNSFSAEE